MDDRLAEREAVEASREPSGVGYSEESEEKECSDMAGREMSLTLTSSHISTGRKCDNEDNGCAKTVR